MKDLLEAKKELDFVTKKLQKIRDNSKDHPSFKNLLGIEPEYQFFWVKYNQDEDQYKDDFRKISLKIIKIIEDNLCHRGKIEQSLSHYYQKHSQITEKIRNLEKKYEVSNEVLRKKKKLKQELTFIGYVISANATESRRALSLKHISEKEFLKIWKEYKQDSKLEVEFLKSSNEYGRCWNESIKEETKYRQWKKNSPYDKRIIKITKKLYNLEERLEQDL